MQRFRIGFAGLGLLWAASSIVSRTLSAQPTRAQRADVAPSPVATLRGTVTDAASGTPVRALVTVAPGGAATWSSRSLRTDSAGRFIMSDVPAGEVTVTATAFGYRFARQSIRATASDTTDVGLVMTALPHALEALRVTATLDPQQAQAAAPAGSTTIGMSSRELSSLPVVGEPDVLRAMSLLPGIAARNDFWAGFNVRGGESDQTQVRLDGLPIISPFHLGGLFSTFIADAVQRVDARVGALPASYGGRLSGVLDVTSAEEPRAGIHGSLDVTAISTSATVGGALPIATGSWNLALRRTYVDALAALLRGPGSFPYHFRDAQLHAAIQARGGGTLALTAYTGLDLLNPTAADAAGSAFTDSATAFRFDWGNTVVGATFTQPLGASAGITQRISYSRFGTSYANTSDDARLVNHIGDLQLAGDVTRRFGGDTPALTLRAGYELSRLRTRYDEHLSAEAADETFGTTLVIDDTVITQRASARAGFGEALWTPNARLSVRAGVRSDAVPLASWSGVSPRFSVKYRLLDRLSFSAAVGRYAQWTHAVRNEDLPVRIVDIWFASDSTVPVSTGTERVVGTELWLTDNDLVRVDAYEKHFSDLIEPSSTIDPRLRPSELRAFGGVSRGLEVLVRHVATARWSGWVAYSLGRSTREQGDERYFAAHDRRHDLNIVTSYRANSRTTLSARYGAASGTPYTGWSGTYARWSYDPVARRWRAPGFSSSARNEQVRTPRNTERYPSYQRLDVSAQREFRVRGLDAGAFLSLVNVLGTRNVLAYAIDNEANPPTLRGFSQLPFLPSLGMRVTF